MRHWWLVVVDDVFPVVDDVFPVGAGPEAQLKELRELAGASQLLMVYPS